MAKSQKSQSAAIHFGAALKASFLCLLIAGSAVGYVWQKSQVYQLAQQEGQLEIHLKQLQKQNLNYSGQVSALRSPLALDRGAGKLGLAPAQPMQVVRLPEPLDMNDGSSMRQLAQRMQ
jgi:cell division protein FtsL